MATQLFHEVFTNPWKEREFNKSGKPEGIPDKYFSKEEMRYFSIKLQEEVSFVKEYTEKHAQADPQWGSRAHLIKKEDYIKEGVNPYFEPEVKIFISKSADRIFKIAEEKFIYEMQKLRMMGFTEEEIEEMQDHDKPYPYFPLGYMPGEHIPHEIFMGIFINSLMDITGQKQHFARETYAVLGAPAFGPFEEQEQPRDRDPIRVNVLEEELLPEGYINMSDWVMHKETTPEMITLVLKYLFNYLLKMYEAYHYTHYDLHLGNILINPVEFDIKIIDYATNYVHIPADYNENYKQITGRELNIPTGDHGMVLYSVDKFKGYWFHDVMTVLMSIYRITDYVENNGTDFVMKVHQLYWKLFEKYENDIKLRVDGWYYRVKKISEKVGITSLVTDLLKEFKVYKKAGPLTEVQSEFNKNYAVLYFKWANLVSKAIQPRIDALRSEAITVDNSPDIIKKHHMSIEMIDKLLKSMRMDVDQIAIDQHEIDAYTFYRQPSLKVVNKFNAPVWDTETGRPIDIYTFSNTLTDKIKRLLYVIYFSDPYYRPSYHPGIADPGKMREFVTSF